MSGRILTLFAAAVLATSSFAADKAAVTFQDTFAKPALGEVGIAFFTATSTVNDAVTGVSSACCKAVEIHRSEKINGIMSMRLISNLTLKKATKLRVQPDSTGGEHVMLIGLKKPLNEGDAVDITFTFEKAPEKTVTFPVKNPEAPADSTESHGHH